jgi:acyl transferase domain-containing protein
VITIALVLNQWPLWAWVNPKFPRSLLNADWYQGCRFAGDSFSPSKLWDMLKDGRSGQSDVPKNRFSIESWHSPAKGRPGSLYSKGGYFLSHDDSYRNFDPSFFAISPLEATSMDPQQRKLLEVVFECFESAGKSLDEMSGSETACYVGCFSTDFDHIQSKDPEYSVPYQSTV